MFKSLLKKLAWKIIRKDVNEMYIHRSALAEYTKWMSRDFPIMEDMYTHLQKRGNQSHIALHRQMMANKYKTIHADKSAASA